MSVSSQTTRVAATITALPQTITVDFQFNLATDLLVLDGGAENTGNDPATVLTLNSDYSVSGGGYNSENQLQEGSITVNSGGDGDVQVGDVVTIIRQVPLTQATTFAETGIQTPLMIEADDDKITTILQQLQDLQNLCLQMEKQETFSGVLERAARAGMLLGFTSSGQPTFVNPAGLIGGQVIQGLTAYTGASSPSGAPTSIDGIEVDNYPTPYLFGCVITVGGVTSLKWYQLVASSASPDGYSIIEPVQNSALRLIVVG